MDVTPTVTNVMDYVAIVKDRSTLRQIAEAANALNSMVANNEGTSAEVLEAAEQRIYAIRQGKSAQGLHHITSVMHEVYDRLAELASSDSAVPGCPPVCPMWTRLSPVSIRATSFCWPHVPAWARPRWH